MNRNELPILVIGGAPKSGTTSLYYYLKQHPEMCLSPKKELHFFSRPDLEACVHGPGDRYITAEVPKTFDQYFSSFKRTERSKVLVDISPSYLFHWKSSGRIKSHFGVAKMVFILRNPAEKAYSQYLHLYSAGREALTFDEALQAEESRISKGYSDMWLYRESGFYEKSISHHIDVLGKENVKVYFYEEFVKNPDGVLREICEFAGVDDGFVFEHFEPANKSGLPKSILLAKIIAPNFFTYFLRRIVPKSLGRKVRKWLKDTNTANKPEMSSQTYNDLMKSFEGDIDKLSLVLGKRPCWEVKK